MRLLRTALVVAAVAALSSGCGDDDPSATTTTTETTTTSTTDAAPTTATAPTTTTPACGPVTLADGASEVTEVAGDADGDGSLDRLRTYVSGDEWHLQVELAAGGGADLVIPTFGGGVGIVGSADVDGDGAEEVWARTGAGASTTILGLARLVECGLVRVTSTTGEPAELPVGGSVGTTSGLECSGGGLTTFTASLREGTTYDVVATTYALDGTALVPTDETTTVADALDDSFSRYATFSCGDLVL